MKPLTLEIAGLNSFRKKQVIEFAALLEDGLFGIFGPTGSGKSSILDAITLALYGKVKRAQGGKGGIINVREKTCSVRFDFEIDRDGSRRRYGIERVLGRASGRADGVQTKRARLIEFDGAREIPIAEKQAEIDGKILELLGIEYDEFMRAVILPQGAFADFLGLKPKERAGVLQRLFGLQELGYRLSSRLKAQADELRTKRAGLEGRLIELRACDDAAVAAAETRLGEAREREERARVEREAAAAELSAAESLWALLEERVALAERDLHRGELEADLAALRLRLERSERATSIAAAVDALERAVARCDESRRGHDAATAALKESTERLEAARERHALVESHFVSDHDRLCEEINRLDAAARELKEIERQMLEADNRERERQALRATLETSEASRAGLRAQIETSARSIAENEARLKQVEVSREEHDRLSGLRLVIERLRERERQLAELGRAVAQLGEQIEATAGEIAAAKAAEEQGCAAELSATSELAMKRGEVEQTQSMRSKLETEYLQLRGVLRMVEQLEAQYREHELVCAAARSTVDKHRAEWTVFEHRFHGISERKKALELERLEAQERLQLAYRRFAVSTLVPQLKDGAPCPLCGSLEHPQRAHDGMMGDEEELTACEGALRRVEEELQKATDRFTRCGQEWGELQTAMKMQTEQLQQAESMLVTMSGSIREALTAAGEELPLASSDDLRRYIETVKENGIAARERRDAASARLKELEELVPTLTARIAEQSRRSIELQASDRGMRERQLEARNGATILGSEIATLRSEIADGSGGRSPEQVEAELERLRENDHAAQHLREVIGNEQRKIAVVRGELDDLDRTVNEQLQRHAAAASLVVRITEEIETRRAAVDERLAGMRGESERGAAVEQMLEARTTLRDALVRERSEAEKLLADAVGDERLRRQDLEHRAEVRARDEADRDRLDADCRRGLEAAGFASSEEAREARLEGEEQRALRESIAAIEEDLRSTAKRRAEVERLIDGRELDASRLAAVREADAVAARALEEAIGASASSRDELERLRERNAEYHRFTSENADALERERTIEQLGRYLTGDAFVNFLADERLADVCRRATRMLEELSGGRYEIFSRPDEGFLVRDMGNGGIERGPGSLSGGETFVVSLSLALALSDTIQLGRGPLEFFFLDEGFGTLDAELLDTVVDTLERLRSRRRTVGLITHVGALRERIGRRLVVTPPTESAGSLIRYEVA